MTNPYETDRLLGEYLLFHYGRTEEILPAGVRSPGMVEALDFAVRAVTETLDLSALAPDGRALDLGCAVGRSSFELARQFAHVVGIDFSQKFVAAAQTIGGDRRLIYRHAEEGRLKETALAELPEDIDRTRVEFETGDACNLREDLGTFDAALLINLIDRLPDPRACLRRLPSLVVPGGQLVVASPYTWLEEYTSPDRWLGGFEHNGQPVRGFDTLCAILDADFEFQRRVELPFLIREHVRKFQWSVSLAGIWRRRSS